MGFKEKLVSSIGSSLVVLYLFSVIGETFACKGYFVRGKDYQIRGLIVHNMLRKVHGAPVMVLKDDLNWGADKCAKNYARRGVIDHKCPYMKGVGENIWMSSSTENVNPVASADSAVRTFYKEIKDYNFTTNDAREGKDFYSIGHFTQVIWDTSTELGIGFALGKEGNVIVALYRRPGNSAEYKNHVFTPKSSPPKTRVIGDLNGVGRIIRWDIMIIILWALVISHYQYYI